MKTMFVWPGIVITSLITLIIGTGCNPAMAEQQEQVIKISAKKFEYSPKEIKLRKGVPAVLEISALDRLHGFNCPDLKIRADLVPGKVTIIRFIPEKSGSFACQCDVFCGDGHEDMAGTITVTE